MRSQEVVDLRSNAQICGTSGVVHTKNPYPKQKQTKRNQNEYEYIISVKPFIQKGEDGAKQKQSQTYPVEWAKVRGQSKEVAWLGNDRFNLPNGDEEED